MSTPGARAGLETFDDLNIEYENAYRDNAFKVACVRNAISLVSPGSRVLDVGCGTGIPVSQMLGEACLEVVGFDISPKMIDFASTRVKGSFSVSDMLEYQPQGEFAAVFIIFAQLQLSYADFHAAAYKFARTLLPGGIIAIGQMPADKYVKDPSDYDETGPFVENYDAPFMGEPIPTFMFSAQGQRNFLTSMGLDIVSETIGMFQPNNPKCVPEEQQYIIARRTSDAPLEPPKPLPSRL